MFNLSNQTNLFLIVIIITTIINLICITIVFKGIGFMMFIILALLSTPTYILYIYNVNCLTAGDCQLWSWYVTIISSISLIIVSVIMIYLTSVSSEQNNATISLSSSITKPIELKVNKPITAAPITPIIPITPITPVTPVTPVTPPYTGLTQEEYKKQFEQHTQKDLFISEQFKRTNLTREEKNELWRQQLELEYQGLQFAQKDIQTYLLRKNLTPEVRQLQHNIYVINQRFIKQRENPIYTNKSRIEYPPLLGNFYPHRIESIKLKIKLVIEQIQIIQNELLNSSLPNVQRIILQQQLRILQKMQDDLPPQPGNYLYEAYIASQRSSNPSNPSNPSNSSNSSNSSTRPEEAPKRATAEAVLIQGEEVPIINLTKTGEGYLTPPTVVFNGGAVPNGGTMATAVAVLGTGINSDKVDRIVYTNYGSGYANYGNGYGSPPIISFTGGTAVPGKNIVPPIAIATKYQPIIISSIRITDPGAGYTSAPEVLITVGGGSIVPYYNDGVGNNGRIAKAKAILGNTTGFTDKVVNIILEDAGFNYSNTVPIILTPPPGNTSNPSVYSPPAYSPLGFWAPNIQRPSSSASSPISPPVFVLGDDSLTYDYLYKQELYLNQEFSKSYENLKLEERNSLWQKQLQLIYRRTIYMLNMHEKELLRQNINPEEKQNLQNLIIIITRLIGQQENLKRQNILPQLEYSQIPQIESLNFQILLLKQQTEFINQELQINKINQREQLQKQLILISGIKRSILFSKQIYISYEFEKFINKSNLNQQELRKFIEFYLMTLKISLNIGEETLLDPNISSEYRKYFQDFNIIYIILIQQLEKMLEQNQLPQLEPNIITEKTLENLIKQLLTQHKQFIQQELLKPELQTSQIDKLQQQLTIIDTYNTAISNRNSN
jgi:hypothetical protein